MTKINDNANCIEMANVVLKALAGTHATFNQGITACCHARAMLMNMAEAANPHNRRGGVPGECADVIEKTYTLIKNGTIKTVTKQNDNGKGRDEGKGS